MVELINIVKTTFVQAVLQAEGNSDGEMTPSIVRFLRFFVLLGHDPTK